MTMFIVGLIGLVLGAIATTLTIGYLTLGLLYKIMIVDETPKSLKFKLDVILGVKGEEMTEENCLNFITFLSDKCSKVIRLKYKKGE